MVHYINELSADLDGDLADTFTDVAKHYSEMKGFALSLQFNRLSALSDAQFVELHDLLGQAPDLDDVAAYQTDLIAARALIGAAYGFDAGNLIAW